MRGIGNLFATAAGILVLGMMRDKDHLGFAKPFRGLVDQVVLTQAGLSRSATVDELYGTLHELWPSARTEAVLADALTLARRLARTQDLICVTGVSPSGASQLVNRPSLKR